MRLTVDAVLSQRLEHVIQVVHVVIQQVPDGAQVLHLRPSLATLSLQTQRCKVSMSGRYDSKAGYQDAGLGTLWGNFCASRGYARFARCFRPSSDSRPSHTESSERGYGYAMWSCHRRRPCWWRACRSWALFGSIRHRAKTAMKVAADSTQHPAETIHSMFGDVCACGWLERAQCIVNLTGEPSVAEAHRAGDDLWIEYSKACSRKAAQALGYHAHRPYGIHSACLQALSSFSFEVVSPR